MRNRRKNWLWGRGSQRKSKKKKMMYGKGGMKKKMYGGMKPAAKKGMGGSKKAMYKTGGFLSEPSTFDLDND